MKRQINIILYLVTTSIILINQCSEIKGCKDQCKNKTRDCILKNQLLSRTITTSIGGSSSSSSSTGIITTASEVEPNDTFQDSYKSSSNALRGSVGTSWVLNATISSSSDIDIFDVGTNNSKDGTQNITQKNNLDKVTCNVYLKHGTNVRDSVSRLQTPTSTPDSSFGFQGKLNPSFSFAYIDVGAVAYLICSGTANTAYSLQLDSVAAASSSASALSSYTDYSFISSCTSATKTCETKCSRSF